MYDLSLLARIFFGVLAIIVPFGIPAYLLINHVLKKKKKNLEKVESFRPPQNYDGMERSILYNRHLDTIRDLKSSHHISLYFDQLSKEERLPKKWMIELLEKLSQKILSSSAFYSTCKKLLVKIDERIKAIKRGED